MKKRTGLNVKAMLPTPLGLLESFPGTSQFNALEILNQVNETMERLRTDYGAGMVIVLTNKDINQPQRQTRFVFSFSDFSRRASVISSSRLALGETMGIADPRIINERVLKFSLRCIGEHFKLPRNTDQNTVMFAPIMSLMDVDRMGTSLRIERQK